MTPATVEDGAVLLDFSAPDPREREIDVNDTRTAEDLAAEFESGMLSADDFEQPAQRRREDYGPDEGVPVFPDELPAELESDAPQVELLLNADQAHGLLDALAPGWRQWGPPPTIITRGRGWFVTPSFFRTSQK